MSGNGAPRVERDGDVVRITMCRPEKRNALSREHLTQLLAAFTDVGNAFDNFGDPLMYSVGLGVRFRLPVVSVGLDVAQALTTPAGETERPGPRLHLNFSPKL